MSLRTLELEILRELRVVAKDAKLRLKDIQEWSTGKIKPHEGEIVYFLPALKMSVAVKKGSP